MSKTLGLAGRDVAPGNAPESAWGFSLVAGAASRAHGISQGFRFVSPGVVAERLESAEPRMYYELGGPRIYTYRALLQMLARHLGRKPILVPIPFGLWFALAYVAEMLPQPPITRNQVELMQIDSVASPGAPGFDDLRISPTSLQDVLPAIMG